MLIGAAGMSVVEVPPAAVLINEKQAAANKVVLTKLERIETMLMDVRSDVVLIKKSVNNTHN